MKLEKRKIKRFQSTLDVVELSGFSNRLKNKAQEMAQEKGSPTSPGSNGPKFNV
jgi:hypothetical protein